MCTVLSIEKVSEVDLRDFPAHLLFWDKDNNKVSLS